MDNRKIIMEKIQSARGDLLTALNLLIDENEDGNQFDYCTSPKLSDSFDVLNKTVEGIGKIIYQEV